MMRAWLQRRWFDLVVVGGLVLAVTMVHTWRQEQFEGFGLRATFFEQISFEGRVFRTSVDPFLDLSDDKDADLFERDHFSVVWSGTLVIPRDGLYRFMTESDDGSYLEIDGHLVVNNGGVHDLARKDGARELRAGPHDIQVRYFQAGGSGRMRVYWKPHDRRGDFEYVPPTLLYPNPPDEVEIGGASAIPPRDLPALTMLGLALLGACLLWGRRAVLVWLRRLRAERWVRIDLLLVLILFGAALFIRLWDLSAAGQTWDEDVYWASGRNYVQNLLAADFRAASWAWNIEHPALAKWLYGPASLAAETFEPARYLSAVLGALTCVLVFLTGRDLVGRGVGFMGAGLCLVLPHVIAHHKIVGLETPSGLFYTLGVWLCFRGLRKGGNTGFHLCAGVAVGLALATRLSNLSLVLALVLLYLYAYRDKIWSERRFPVSITLGLMPLAAGVTFFALWPYLWENPLQHLGEMLAHWRPDIYLELFLGARREPPLYYFPLYFAVTTPVVALVPLLLGVVRVFFRRDLGHAALLIWFAAPFVVVFSPMARDGVRYLFPALIAGCLLAAVGIDWIGAGIGRLVKRSAARVPAAAILGVVTGLFCLRAGLSVHPYYLDYYNELVGGPRTVAEHRLFETGWWGEGLQEANEYVRRTADHGAKVMIHAHPPHVIRLRPDLVRVHELNEADFIIFNNLFNPTPKLPHHRVAFVVRAAGAPLVWVYQREESREVPVVP